MGGKKDKPESINYYFLEKGRYVNEDNLHYDSSWDWLMPVVERIECFCDVIVHIDGNSCVIDIDEAKFGMPEEQIIVDADSKIEAVYGAVVSFIEWWNNANVTSPSTAEKMLNASFHEPFE